MLLATVVLLIAVLIVALRWLVRRSLAPERIPEHRSPEDFCLSYSEVRLPTANAKFLFGWFVPANRMNVAPAVVILHGWGGNAETMLPLARPLHEAGYTTLFIDARCHGRSDEDTFVSLPRFAEDLEHAIDWMRARSEVDPVRIAVLGHSVGAGAALLAACRRADIAAVVSIAAFAHPATMMRRWLAGKGIPYLPIGWLILHYVEWVIGHRFDAIAPLHTIGKVRCPTLLIHGAADETVPVAEAEAIYAARSGEHVHLKVVSGSHDEYGNLDQEIAVLVEFLSKGLGKAEESGITLTP